MNKQFEKEHNQFWDDEISNKKTPFEQFQCFVIKYKNKNNRNDPFAGAKFSEWFFEKFLNFVSNLSIVNRCSGEKINIKFGGKAIPRKFDLRVEASDKRLLFDIKKNLDLVEKDLFKAFLASEDESFPKFNGRNAIFLLIWEEEDHSRKKGGKDSPYLTLLEEFRTRGLILDFAYLTRDNENGFKTGLEKVLEVLHTFAPSRG